MCFTATIPASRGGWQALCEKTPQIGPRRNACSEGFPPRRFGPRNPCRCAACQSPPGGAAHRHRQVSLATAPVRSGGAPVTVGRRPASAAVRSLHRDCPGSRPRQCHRQQNAAGKNSGQRRHENIPFHALAPPALNCTPVPDAESGRVSVAGAVSAAAMHAASITGPNGEAIGLKRRLIPAP